MKKLTLILILLLLWSCSSLSDQSELNYLEVRVKLSEIDKTIFELDVKQFQGLQVTFVNDLGEDVFYTETLQSPKTAKYRFEDLEERDRTFQEKYSKRVENQDGLVADIYITCDMLEVPSFFYIWNGHSVTWNFEFYELYSETTMTIYRPSTKLFEDKVLKVKISGLEDK